MKLEVFEDRMYWDQFAVRPEGSSDFTPIDPNGKVSR